jgi:hypothetical protein
MDIPPTVPALNTNSGSAIFPKISTPVRILGMRFSIAITAFPPPPGPPPGPPPPLPPGPPPPAGAPLPGPFPGEGFPGEGFPGEGAPLPLPKDAEKAGPMPILKLPYEIRQLTHQTCAPANMELLRSASATNLTERSWVWNLGFNQSRSPSQFDSNGSPSLIPNPAWEPCFTFKLTPGVVLRAQSASGNAPNMRYVRKLTCSYSR